MLLQGVSYILTASFPKLNTATEILNQLDFLESLSLKIKKKNKNAI